MGKMVQSHGAKNHHGSSKARFCPPTSYAIPSLVCFFFAFYYAFYFIAIYFILLHIDIFLSISGADNVPH